MIENNNPGGLRVGPPIIDPSVNVPLQSYSNSYDDNYRQGYNQTWNRSTNQSGLAQLGYGLLSRTASIVPKLGAGVGSIIGVGRALAKDDITEIWDNPITEWFNGLDESLKEALPVYSSQRNDTSGLFGKMTTTSFWANDGFDAFAYAASAFVPGAVIGATARGASTVLKASDIGRKLVDGLGKVGLNSQRLNLTASTVYNTISESAAEAFQTQKELEGIYLDKGMDKDEAKQKAGEAAARVFRTNLIALAAPNLIQNTLFHGGWDATQKSVRKNIWDLAKVEELDSLWKKVGGSMVSEGFWEENIQTATQQFEKNMAKNGFNGDSRAEEIGKTMANNIGAFFGSFVGADQTADEIEGATSIFLGGLIGGLAATRGHIIEKKQRAAEQTAEQTRYDEIFKTIGPAAMGIMSENVKATLKTNGKKKIKQGDAEIEVDDIVLNDENKAIVDEQKLLQVAFNTMKNKSLWDAQAMAVYHNDRNQGELVMQAALASYVHSLMNGKYEYTAEEVGKFLDRNAELGTAEAEQLGVTTYIKENMEMAKEYAKTLETIKSSNSSVAKDSKASAADHAFNDYMTKTELYLTLKKKALEKTLQAATTDAGKEGIDKVLQDTNEYLGMIKNEKSAIRKEFDKTVVDRSIKNAKRNEAIAKKDTAEADKLTFQLAEDEYINGDWAETANARTLPSLEARETAKVAPGSRDRTQYDVGRSALTIDRITTALTNNTDPVSIAEQLVNNVSVVNSENEALVQTQVDQIKERLEQESVKVNEQFNKLATLDRFSQDLQNVESGESVKDAFEQELGFAPEDTQLLLNDFNKLGPTQIELTSTIDDLLDAPEFSEFLKQVKDKLETSAVRERHISELLTEVEKKDFSNERAEKYDKATDKEEFLRKEYYDNHYVKTFDLAKITFLNSIDDIDDEVGANNLKRMFELVVAGTIDDDTRVDAQEKLDYINKIIIPQIIKNIFNRAEVHRKINALVVNGMVLNMPIDAIVKILGNEDIKAFLDADQQDVKSFDALITLLNEVKVKAPTEVTGLLEGVEKSIQDQVTSFINLVYPNYESIQKSLDSKRTNGEIQNNVYHYSKVFLNLHFKEKYGKKLPSEVIRYQADLDIALLYKSSQKSSNLTTEDKELIKAVHNLYFNIVGANIVKDVLNADIDARKMEDFKEKIDTTPSLQQNIALTQAALFLNRETKGKSFYSWLLVRGIGGSGKSYFLGHQLNKLVEAIDGKAPKFVAFSKEDLASANINRAVDSKNPAKTTFRSFSALSEQALSELDYIIIDEIFTFTNAEIYEIRDKAEKAGIKVIALGDASQLTAEAEPAILSGVGVNMTLPLTTSYRTNVTAVASFINRYRLNSEEVNGAVAASNVNFAEAVSSPSEANGVIGVSPDQLDALLQVPSSRSRVLIVQDQNAKSALGQAYPGVDIKTPSEAQGIQWDEVYSLLAPIPGVTAFENNRILYTAYSRAKSLLVVTEPQVVNAEPSQELSKEIENSPNELLAINQMFVDNLDSVKQLRSVLNGVPFFTAEETTPTEVVFSDEPATDIHIANAASGDLDPMTPDPIANPEGYEFMSPNNYGVMSQNAENMPRLAPNAKLYFIKVINSKKEVYFKVVAQNQWDRDGKFFEVARLGKEDFKNPATKAFFSKMTKVDREPLDELNVIQSDLTFSNIDNIAVGTATATEFTKFKTLTVPEYTSERNLFPGAKDLVEDAIIKAYITYYPDDKFPNKPWVTKIHNGYEVNWANIHPSSIRMTIPTDKDTKSTKFGWRSHEHNPRGLNVYQGVPYLIIDKITPNAKPLLIRFQPKMLNTTNPYIATLRELYKHILVVEKLTGKLLSSEDFSKIIETYKSNNYKVVGDKMVAADVIIPIKDVPQSIELDTAVKGIIELLYQAEKAPLKFETEEEANEYLKKNGAPHEGSSHTVLDKHIIVSVSQGKDKKWVLNYGDSTDSAVHSIYETYQVRRGSGKAQVALNSIARANNRIDEDLIRRTDRKANEFRILKISRSPSILLSKDYVDYHGFYKDPVITNLLDSNTIDRIQMLALSENADTKKSSAAVLLDVLSEAIAKKDNISISEAKDEAMKMIGQYTTSPITSELLNRIVGDEAFNERGEHNQLRTPLNLHNTAKTGINDLGADLHGATGSNHRNQLTAMLRHNFDGFQRTRIFFDSPELAAIKVTPKPPREVKNTIQGLLQTVQKKTGITTYDNVIAILTRLGINAEVIALPDGLPALVDGKIVFIKRPGAASVVEDGKATIYSYPHDFEDISTNTDKLQIFLHESLHVATQDALHKGQSDSRKKLNTKEAEFYRKIQAIKKRFDSAIRSKRNPVTGERLKTSDVYQATPSTLDVNEFMANLSNPAFVEFAKSISLVPSGSKKSVLREILEAILDLFKSILGTNPSVYDAAMTALEDFYVSNKTKVELVTPQVTHKVEDLIADINAQIGKVSENRFDSLIAKLKTLHDGVIDPDSYPESYSEDYTLRVTDDFSKLTLIEQSLKLSSGNIQNAWYDITKDRVSYSSGQIKSSSNVTTTISNLLSLHPFSASEKRLITSIVRQEILGAEIINELNTDVNTGEHIIATIIENVLSRKDKEGLKLAYEVQSDSELIEKILDGEVEAGFSFATAADFFTKYKNEVKELVESAKNNSTLRYRDAKSYVEKMIKANLDLDLHPNPTELIQTMPYVRDLIRATVTGDDPILLNKVLVFGQLKERTLSEGEDDLKDMYARLNDPKTSERDKNKLRYIDIPKLDNEISALIALRSETSDGKKELLVDLIIRDLYPNADLSEVQTFQEELYHLAEEEYLSEDEVAFESAGISEFFRKYDKSYENTLSESLKNSFRKITLGNRVISPGLAYVKTLQLVMSLDWNLHEKNSKNELRNLPYILEQLKELYNETTSELTKSIIKNLETTILYSITNSFTDEVSLKFNGKRAGIVLFKNTDNTIHYGAYVANENIENAETLTYQEIIYRKTQGEDIAVFLPTNPTEVKNTEALYYFIQKEIPELTKKQFNRLFMKGESLNTIRAVHNTMASMKETLLYTANRKSRKGNEFRFQRAVASGVSFRIKDQLKSNLTEMYEYNTLANFGNYFNGLTVGGKTMKELRETPAGRLKLIAKFFEELKIPVKDFTIKKPRVIPFVKDIDGFFTSTSLIKEYKLVDEFDDTIRENAFDIVDWFDTSAGVDGYLSRFSDVLASSDSLVRNQSVRDMNGKKFYSNHESSHIYDTLLNLAELDSNNRVFRGGTGSNHNIAVPAFLKSPISNPEEVANGADPKFLTSYYDHNIFVRGQMTNKIHTTIEIDGARNLMNNSVTAYTRENMFFYFHRNFSQQFLDAVRQFKGESYFQSTITPSDSPKAMAIRVGILSDNPTKEHPDTPIMKSIEQMLKQILERQNLSSADFNNFDDSNQNDPFRMFKIGERAVARAAEQKIEFNAKNIPQIAKFAYSIMSQEAELLLDQLMSSDVELSLDVSTFEIAEKLLGKLNSSRFSKVSELYTSDPKLKRKAKTRQNKQYVVNKDDILPLFDLWFKNNYVNSFFLNQIILGDYAAFANSGGLVKRFAGAKGPRIRPLLDSVAGMNPTRQTLVIGDLYRNRSEAEAMFADLLYDIKPNEEGQIVFPENFDRSAYDTIIDALPPNFNSTDAQGFFTRKFMAALSRGFEAAWGLGDVSKPIGYEIQQEIIGDYVTGKPVYNKYSAVLLDNAMTDRFPRLRKLQRALEILGVDEAVHPSAMKLGVPKVKDSAGNDAKLLTMNDLIDATDEQLADIKNWKVSPIIELSNASFGFQFNAASDPNKEVSLFTQLMYMLNAYDDKLSGEFGTTQDAAKEVYELVGSLIATGRESFMKEIGNDSKGLIRYLKKNLKGAGAERELQLLEAGISLDHPLIEQKAIIKLASGLEKATVKVKFKKGAKLVLQTPEGISKYGDPTFFKGFENKTPEELEYRKETLPNGRKIMVAECIVPRELLSEEHLQALKLGQSIYLMPDMLGFRLPSTELHSAVAIRVVGIYSNRKTNVIIAPRMLVPIQGQDFDVDSLFIITKDTFTQAETTLIDSDKIVTYANNLKEVLNKLTYAESKLPKEVSHKLQKIRRNIQDISGLIVNIEDEHATKFETQIIQIAEQLDKFRIDADLKDAYMDFMIHIEAFTSLMTSKENVIGAVDAPVGYEMDLESGKYVIDNTFLASINNTIDKLRSLGNIRDSSATLERLRMTELKKAESLRGKYIQNRIVDIVLDVVSDFNNAARSFNAISFTPLKDAIANINTNLVKGNENLDLSHAGDQFAAYLSVASGEALIGAFANGSKSFGYTSRAGGTDISNLIFKLRGRIQKTSKLLDAGATDLEKEIIDIYKASAQIVEIPNEDIPTQAMFKKIDEALKEYALANIESIYRNIDSTPVLNPKQAFAIKENGKTVVYNKLSDSDSDGKYRTTQVYSTLTNAAVDDLNQGYLSRAKINTNTGSAIIGMTALGVPLRIAIKLLHQPILASLSGGKINNLATFVSAIREKYGTALDLAGAEDLDVFRDLDTFVDEKSGSKHQLQNMNVVDMLDKLTPNERDSQLKVLALFLKADKIGTDFKNLAKFLDILRQWDVTIEDISKVEDNLIDNIGTPTTLSSGELVISTRSSFSFNIPNILQGSRHIKEAYISHRALSNKIEQTFVVHSKPINNIAKGIVARLSLAENEKANVLLTNIRRSLQQYVISGLVKSNVTKGEVVKYKRKDSNQETKFVTSAVNGFINETAKKIALIKDKATESQDDNMFLDNLIVVLDKFRQSKLSFKTGVGLLPEDHIDMLLGFKNLNQYDIIDGVAVKVLPDSSTAITPIQRALVDYSILTSGLKFGGSNFASYITPEVLLNYDKLTNIEMQKLANGIVTDDFKNHFYLSYVLMNAVKLPFISAENLEPVVKGTATTSGIYGGVDTVNYKKVYFDVKAKLQENEKGQLLIPPEFIKRDYGRDVSVYKLVTVSMTSAYYQLVGKANNFVFRPLAEKAKYDLENYFNPNIPNVNYFYEEKDNIYSHSQLVVSLPVGTEMYIYPTYSQDRAVRKKVKIVSITKSDLGGHKIKVEEVEGVIEVKSSGNDGTTPQYRWSRYSNNGYEVSSAGDSRFSALNATLEDGRTIEEAYQLDIKGYRSQGNDWRLGKGKPPIKYSTREDMWNEYFELWELWAQENPALIADLAVKAKDKTLTDKFANTDVSQARALAQVLNKRFTIVNGTSYNKPYPYEEINDYVARLTEMNYTPEQIGEALKLNCKPK